jgi:WD40 repeat protein
MTATQVPVAHRDSPYFGLDYYDEKFGAWFFGREADGGKIITNLRAARLTLLHAESGVGKTSLLRAGVAWRLHRLADDMFTKGRPVRSIPVVFSSWKDDPATELAAAVDAAVRPYLGNGGMPARVAGPLDAALEAASAAAGATLCIMLDQFEEYFLYRSREPVPGRFADELARCVNRTDLRANFLIAIREDAYAELGDLFKARITNVYGNYLHIDYLDRASAEKAIRGPVEVYNSQPGVAQPVTVQDELVEAVLDEVRAWGGPVPAAAANGGRDRIATPLLQLVMQRVWDTERAEGSHQLRVATLQRLRGVTMIVDDHLGQALGSLSGAERETAIDMFDHLVTPSGGKIAESVSDLAKRTGHTEDQVDGVLRKLDDERILRPVPAAPGQDPVRSRRYEIFHDVLASPINRAIAARAEQRRVRRFRRLAALAVAMLMIVSAVAVVFAYLLNNANSEKLTAESRELAADADLNVARDPELSTSLALQALKLSPTSQAADALRATLPELQLLKTLHDGTGVSSVAFDPADSSIVASADYSGVVWIWNIRTGRRERLSPHSDQSSGGATSVAFNSAGTKVAVGFWTGPVDVFDARNGRIQKTNNVEGLVTGLDFAGGTSELAIVVSERTSVLWLYGTTQCCDTKLNLPGSAYSIAANPRDPDEFAVTTSGGVFIVTVDHSGKLQSTLHLTSQFSDDVKFSPDGSEVVTPDADGNVSIYRVATRKIVTTFSVRGVAAQDAAFSPDGKQIVAGYQDGTGRVWDIATRLQRTLLSGHTGSITNVEFSPDGREVATASADGTIRVWDAEPRELRADFTVPLSGGTSNSVDRAEYISSRIITTDDNGNVFVYSPAGKLQATIKAGNAGQQVSWDRAGTKIITLTFDGTAELWQATGSGYTRISTKAVLDVDDSIADYAVVSPDGSRLAFDTNDTSSTIDPIQVEDVNTGKALRSLGPIQSIGIVALSPNGQKIVGADASGQIEFWSGEASLPQVLGRPGPAFAAVSFNQSGSEFVAASAGGVVTVWNARDGRVVTSINACPSPNSAAFSPDGSKIVTACTDGTVRVFDAGTGRTLTVIQATSAGSVSDAGFSPDGKSIVAGVDAGDSGEIQIWNAELATSSLPALERIAEQRIGDKLTAAQLQQYLSGASS